MFVASGEDLMAEAITEQTCIGKDSELRLWSMKQAPPWPCNPNNFSADFEEPSCAIQNVNTLEICQSTFHATLNGNKL